MLATFWAQQSSAELKGPDSMRPPRFIALASIGALVLSAGAPDVATAAGEPLPVTRWGADARPDVQSVSHAAYVAALTGAKTIVGTFTVPTLGDCSDVNEGAYTGIELAITGGAQYADGGVYNFCFGGAPQHNPLFESNTPLGFSQVPIEQVVQDGDKIKVTSRFRRGKVKVLVENLTQGWSASHNVTGFTPAEASSLYYRVSYMAQHLEMLAQDVSVKGVTVGGLNLKQTDPTKVVLVDDAGPLVRPTKIKNGTDFTYKYVG